MPSSSIPSMPSLRMIAGAGVRSGYPAVAAASIANLLTFYDPLDISTLFQNVAASTPVTTNGQSVGAMTGLVNAVASADDTTRPTYAATGIRGLPAIQFTAASLQKLTANALSASLTGADTPYTLVAVVQVTTPGTSQTFFSAGRSSSGTPFILARAFSSSLWDANRRDDASVGVQITPTAPPVTAAVPVVLAVRFFGTTLGVWVNGVRVDGPTACDVGTLTLDRIAIGALVLNGAYSQYLGGFLGRLALYSAAISDVNVIGLSQNFRDAYQI